MKACDAPVKSACQTRAPVGGICSVLFLAVGSFIGLAFFRGAPGGDAAWADMLVGAAVFVVGALLGTIAAVVGLLRRERWRALCWSGLALNTLPIAFMIALSCRPIVL